MRKLVVLLIIILLIIGAWNTVKTYAPHVSQFIGSASTNTPQQVQPIKVVTEESVTVDAVKKVGPSVVTVVGQGSQQSSNNQQFNLGPFSFFNQSPLDNTPSQPTPQSVGSGFIVSSDGIIVTNKHVIADTTETYQVITADGKKYDVKNIYRDPLNDIGILRIDPNQNAGVKLQPIEMGDSSKLQVGQFAIAIGTALGEFRNTVTTGVISGVGRGIQAGDVYQGSIENLSGVIQTSAAINPGNSGGPLLNAAAQVIGINTAVAQNGQNIGFALPINVVKDTLTSFNQTGQFNRAYLGVEYKTVTRDVAIMNSIPQGAYVQSVVSGSPAEKAGIQQGDIITKADGQTLVQGNNELATVISRKKVGDTITITIWRNGNTQDLSVTLTASQ